MFRRLGGDEAAAAAEREFANPTDGSLAEYRRLLGMIECPVLILAGEDDPVCPLPVAESLASRLPAGSTRLLRLPRARHTTFRDRPDIAFPAAEEFTRRIAAARG